eukprot:TRINITY_DN91895_c0_g1_i1.p1 TRINITY_DN91895_c0_g1~~TRINITY_DN91895_c0_g1_i1.p1  ORF type:complete len:1448 (-),score=184.65 TRINITY_DN91895_c0_g1_i1:24-4367(-)
MVPRMQGHTSTSPVSFFEALQLRAHENGATIAAVDACASQNDSGKNSAGKIGATITYSELLVAAEHLARALAPRIFAQKTGYDKGEPGEPVVATLMQRGCSWYCVFWACVKLQAPVAALSMDLPDKAAERQRNMEMLKTHKPAVLVLDTAAFAGHSEVIKGYESVQVLFDALWTLTEPSPLDTFQLKPLSADATLCFCYTGGTTKASRCVRTTHRMALYELDAYPQVATLGPQDRVMQQHSLYWAASAYGEVDIALAFGCCLVFCEAWDAESFAMTVCSNNITCAGIVPSLLAALEPEDMPSLQLAFTWGEELRTATAQIWAKKLRLIDLLISTECWLSLYAEWNHAKGDARPPFKVLPGVSVRLRQISADGGSDCTSADGMGGTGELLVSGPMVSPGYTDPELNASVFEVDAEGRQWYCTRDCLKYQEDGLVFAGRADDLVKIGGVWVDIREVGACIAAIPGVGDVCVSGRTAYVALTGQLQKNTLPSIRKGLPIDFALVLVPALRRNAGTGKVDRKWLSEISSPPSVPAREIKDAELCIRHLDRLVEAYKPLLFVLLCSACRQWLTAWQTNADHVLLLCCSFFWSLMQDICCRLLLLSYVILSIWHLPPDWTQLVKNFPVGALGAATALCAMLPWFWCVVLAGPGLSLAVWRQRFLSWPLLCAVGYAPWACEASYWLQGYGAVSTAKWHLYQLYVHFPLMVCEFFVYLWTCFWSLVRILRGAHCCSWCKKFAHASKGRFDDESKRPGEPPWYCDACWVNYDAYKKSDAYKARYAPAPPAGGIAMQQQNVQAPSTSHSTTNGTTNGTTTPGFRVTPAGEWQQLLFTSRTATPNKRARSPKLMNDSEAPCRRQRSGSASSGRELSAAEQRAAPDCCISAESNVCDDMEVDNTMLSSKPVKKSSPTQKKSNEWQIIERSASMSFESLNDSLSSLDSLRQTKITSALRREVNKRLPREALRRSTTLGELLNEISQIQEELPLSDQGSGNMRSSRDDSEVRVWGCMWYSRCQWLLRRDRPVSVNILRSALACLIERHKALRAELRDPYRLFSVTQGALTVFEIWRRYGDRWCSTRAKRCYSSRMGQLVQNLLTWSFLHAWPRVGAQPVTEDRRRLEEKVPLMVRPRVANLAEAEQKIWEDAGWKFSPPFQVVCLPYGSEGCPGDGVIVRLLVTHMLSDGYSIMPLLSDLTYYISALEQAQELSLTIPPLPRLPCMFTVCESRLVDTLKGTSRDGGITREPFRRSSRGGEKAQCVYADVPDDIVLAIRQAAALLAVPEDVAVLTVISVALAWFENRHIQPLAIIVPQRDGPAENDMVGLFADVRDLAVRTGGLNLAGVALQLQRSVQERQWRAPCLGDQSDLPMVNFEWTDFDQMHGFAQHVNLTERIEFSRHYLKIVVEQARQGAWRLCVAFEVPRYGPNERVRFFNLLSRAFQLLLERPLDPLWQATST